jgi:hypothetical protein
MLLLIIQFSPASFEMKNSHVMFPILTHNDMSSLISARYNFIMKSRGAWKFTLRPFSKWISHSEVKKHVRFQSQTWGYLDIHPWKSLVTRSFNPRRTANEYGSHIKMHNFSLWDKRNSKSLFSNKRIREVSPSDLEVLEIHSEVKGCFDR